MSATIKDVAKAANVAPSTVSRVIAGNPRISAQTQERVKAAIRELKYRPNAIARSLVNKSNRVLGVVLPSEAEQLFGNPFFIQVLTGISSYAQPAGYHIMYTFCASEQEEVRAVEKYVDTNLVAGILLTVSRSQDRCIAQLQADDFPFAVIGRPENAQDVLWVDNDNFQAMYNVVSRLLTAGHQHIAFVGAAAERNMSIDRLNGYRQAHLACGRAVDEERICQTGEFSEAAGAQAIERILQRRPVSAVVATDDLLAFGVNAQLIRQGRSDVEVIGFNNTPLAAYQHPPLSSVEINAKELGYHAAKLLIERLENRQQQNFFIIGTQLVERTASDQAKLQSQKP